MMRRMERTGSGAATGLRPDAGDWLALAGVAAAGLAVDQLAKAWARAALPLGGARRVVGPLVLRHAENPGVALGTVPAGKAVLVAVATLVAGLLAAHAAWGGLHAAFAPGCGLAVAGCLGNLSDRVLHGHVTDFLSARPLPVCNLADAFIAAGFAVMVGTSALADLPACGRPQRAGYAPAVW